MSKPEMTTNPPLRSPCGKYRSQRGKNFTEQTLRDHILNCPQCNQNRVWLDPDDFIGNEKDLTGDFGFNDEPDMAFWALNAELGGEFDD